MLKLEPEILVLINDFGYGSRAMVCGASELIFCNASMG